MLLLLLATAGAAAQSYPSKPVRMLLPQPPGGTMDLYDVRSALEELREDAVLPHPVRMRDMILRKQLAAGAALELNREFQSYLAHYGEIVNHEHVNAPIRLFRLVRVGEHRMAQSQEWLTVTSSARVRGAMLVVLASAWIVGATVFRLRN